LYVREAGTERMIQLASAQASNTFAVLSLAQVEFRAALRQRERIGDIDSNMAENVLAAFSGHWATVYRIQPVTEAVLEEAVAQVDRNQLRAYDAVQLAGCVLLSQSATPDGPIFTCTDKNLLRAAGEAGVRTFDPTTKLPP
jgi:predicted nucleic acid-binding protein